MNMLARLKDFSVFYFFCLKIENKLFNLTKIRLFKIFETTKRK